MRCTICDALLEPRRREDICPTCSYEVDRASAFYDIMDEYPLGNGGGDGTDE
jgi:hypothetical protein